MDYKISSWGPGQFDGYLDFMRKYANGGEPSESDLRRKWWCFDNAEGGIFAAAHTDDALAATCYLSGKSLSLDGAPIRACEIGETWTAPEHRRRGLFSLLVKHCWAHGYDHGAEIIYGTPNGQSTPGYKKLGFDIIESRESCMLFAVSIPFALRQGFQRLGGNKTAEGAPKAFRDSRYEVSAPHYAFRTVAYPRLNVSGNGYLAWRLGAGERPYRHFRLDGFECSIREGQLGDFPVLVVSEYFLDGKRCPVDKAAGFLRRIAADGYDMSRYAGTHFHGAGVSGLGKLRYGVDRVLVHRVLPICAASKSSAGAAGVDWGSAFQLSDCDIG